MYLTKRHIAYNKDYTTDSTQGSRWTVHAIAIHYTHKRKPNLIQSTTNYNIINHFSTISLVLSISFYPSRAVADQSSDITVKQF